MHHATHAVMVSGEQPAAGSSAWAPFRSGVFRAMWSAQFVINIGGWMQEHLRQHERVTKRDQERFDRIRAMTDPDRPATVTHWIAPDSGLAAQVPQLDR
jgi:hypothetical protein